MANPERGEVDLDIAGKTYTLALGIGALREIQAAATKTAGRRVTFKDVVEGALQADIEYLCLLVWGALRRHHRTVSLDETDELLDRLGGFAEFPMLVQTINELLVSTRPDERDAAVLKKAGDGPERPLEAQAITTGTRSISRRAKSA